MKRSRRLEDTLGIGELGGFVDTVGSTKSKRERLEAESSTSHLGKPAGPSSKVTRDTLKNEVEERLEELLFGKQPINSAEPKSSSFAYRYQNTDSELEEDSEEEEEEEEESDEEQPRNRIAGSSEHSRFEKQPVWHDKDDTEISVDITAHTRTRKLKQTADETTISGTTYSKRLRSQYEKILGQPEWTRSPLKSKKKQHRNGSDSDSDSSDEESSLFQRTGSLFKAPTDQLPRGTLDLKRMKDANSSKRAEAVVRAVEFHPSANVVLVAGYHKTLDLFQVDGQTNPKLQSIHIQGFPISTAHFTQDGKEVVMAARKKRFFVYDMMAGKVTPIFGIRGREERYWDKFVSSPDNQYLVFLGKSGYMVLVSNKTKQWVGELKMNGDVRDVAFTSDSRYMLSTGSEGKVYVWDMSARDCVHCFVDEGCIHGTRLAISPSNQYIACGSDSGVVNLYAGTQCLSTGYSRAPKPVKSVMNLTTGIDSLCFNPTSELMVMASQRKKEALKVVHLPSQTVFSNWPVRKTPLNFVSALDISPQSKYMAIGNAKGRVLLYRFNHYSQ